MDLITIVGILAGIVTVAGFVYLLVLGQKSIPEYLRERRKKKQVDATSVVTASVAQSQPCHNLPQPDYTKFIGREVELKWLRQRLSPNDRTWQIAITGIGGVGKSALAQVIATEFCQRYSILPPQERFEAVVWVSGKEEVLTAHGLEQTAIAGLALRSLEDIYTAIAQALGREDITSTLPENQARFVQKILSEHRVLLIIDNLETITDRRIRSFLRSLPAPTKAIITSREWVDVADILALTGLSLEEAEKLMIEEAAVRHVSLSPKQRRKIFELTSGLPLPIKLGIARIGSGESFEAVIRWLGDAKGDLPAYCVKGQADLARLHDPNAWKLLLGLTLFDSNTGGSRDALGQTVNISIAERDSALALLQRLSLINRTEADRFWLLPMVRGYGQAELSDSEFTDELIQQWLGWLKTHGQLYGTDLDLHIENAQMLGIEYFNLRDGIRWCREHERWDNLIALCESTWFYPYLIGLFTEFREIVQSAIQAATILKELRKEAQFRYRYGIVTWLQGDLDATIGDNLQRAEEIARELHDEVLLAMVWSEQSNYLSLKGENPEAAHLARSVLEASKNFENLELKVIACYRLSQVETKEGNLGKAIDLLDDAESCAIKLGWKRGLAWILYRRGSIVVRQKNMSAAEQFLVQSFEMAESWNERRLMAINQYRLAQVYATTQRSKKALHAAKSAQDLFDRLGMVEDLQEINTLLAQLP